MTDSNTIKAYRWLGQSNAQKKKLLPLSMLVSYPQQKEQVGSSASLKVLDSSLLCSPEKGNRSQDHSSFDWSPSQISVSSTPRLPLIRQWRNPNKVYQTDKKHGNDSSFSPPDRSLGSSAKIDKLGQVENIHRFLRNENDGYLEMIVQMKRLNEKYIRLDNDDKVEIRSEYLVKAIQAISEYSSNIENYKNRVDLFHKFTESFRLGFQSFAKEINPIFALRDSLIYCADEQIRKVIVESFSKPSLLKKNFTYFEGLVSALEHCSKQQKIYDELLKEKQIILNNLQDKVTQQSIQIENLTTQRDAVKQEIQRSKEETTQELTRSILEFQKHQNTLQATLQEDKNNFLQGYFDAEHVYIRQIQECQTAIIQKIEEIKSLKQIKDKQASDFDELRIKFDTLRCNHAASVEELRNMTEKQKDLQDRLYNSQENYRKLQIKSGLMYEDLTPRPSFKDITKSIEDFCSEVSLQSKLAIQTFYEFPFCFTRKDHDQNLIKVTRPFQKLSATLLGQSSNEKAVTLSDCISIIFKHKSNRRNSYHKRASKESTIKPSLMAPIQSSPKKKNNQKNKASNKNSQKDILKQTVPAPSPTAPSPPLSRVESFDYGSNLPQIQEMGFDRILPQPQ